MKLKKFDSINVIPFIDVLLVLLAIVLLTSTFVTKGVIPISLPDASSADNLKPAKEVNIAILEDGKLIFENKDATLESIETDILQRSKETPININTDKNTKFESFVQILDMLKKNNYSNISIVTKK